MNIQIVERRGGGEKSNYSLAPLPNLLAEPEKARTPTFTAFKVGLDTIERAKHEEVSETRIPATRRAGLARVA